MDVLQKNNFLNDILLKSHEIKDHWDRIYKTKHPGERSWTQEFPKTSMDFIRGFNLPKSAKIIDIGGGDSRLVDSLIEEGYENISVLDISGESLIQAKKRLGRLADTVEWIQCDLLEFSPSLKYDLWHDRAAFHFLTGKEQIDKYIDIVRKSVRGYLLMGTFSTTAPPKCSGLEVRRYSEELLEKEMSIGFEKIKCITEDHITPFNTVQNFMFCSFRTIS